MVARIRLLLVDQHQEWLEFARQVLQERYDVLTAMSFGNVSSSYLQKREPKIVDLIFIGLDLAINNLGAIKSLSNQWRFVVMFPVYQADDTLRVLFRTGVFDCVEKPYECEPLLGLVEDELRTAEVIDHRQSRWLEM